jgi:hypothetical protein
MTVSLLSIVLMVLAEAAISGTLLTAASLHQDVPLPGSTPGPGCIDPVLLNRASDFISAGGAKAS